MAFDLTITSLGELGRTTNFHILIHMAIGSYHINKKFRLSPALSLILLSKMTKFSPKNRTFLLIKPDMMVTDTFHWYHTDPQASAVPASCLTQKFWISFPRGSQQLCSADPNAYDIKRHHHIFKQGERQSRPQGQTTTT